MNSKSLENKVAIVTGGAQGIGESIALALQNEGATVVVADLAEVLKNHQENKNDILLILYQVTT